VDIEKGLVKVQDVDMLDGTPLLDIKPYSPELDCMPDTKSGWLDNIDRLKTRSDNRFEK